MEKSLLPNFFCVLVLITLDTINVQSLECGTTDFAVGLITLGSRAERGEWPFLAALHLVKGRTFFCGGSVISAKHVLTAAHCIQRKNSVSQLLPADVAVLFGAYDLTLRNDTEVIQRNVNDINVHPDWDPYISQYDADLAILSLKESVSFTDYIRQVCIPGDKIVIDGATGSVAGWGLTENEGGTNLSFNKHTHVKVLNDSYCYTNDSFAVRISSVRTFCGQGVDGSPNRGDSGGGFYIRDGSSWIQYGIISAIRTDATGYVYPQSITIYTNVTLFKSWIIEIVTDSGGTVGIMIPDVKINLNCTYGHGYRLMAGANNLYTCWLHDLDLQSDNLAVTSFTGIHHFRKTDQDVKSIVFLNGTMFYLPSEIGKIFKKLTHLHIYQDFRTKTFKRSNLKNLESLVELGIDENDIDTLDKYALWDLPNLEMFVLSGNNIKEINGRTFEKNQKLIQIYLPLNQLEVLPSNLFQNNSLLEYVNVAHNSINVIDENIFAKNGKLREIYLYSNKLDALPRNLFQNNPLLQIVEVSDNLLSVIDIDFSVFKNIARIDFYDNICINAYYGGGSERGNATRDLTEFQRLIRTNCSSSYP